MRRTRGRTLPIVKRYNLDVVDKRVFPDVIIVGDYVFPEEDNEIEIVFDEDEEDEIEIIF